MTAGAICPHERWRSHVFKRFRQGEVFGGHIAFNCGWFEYVLGPTGSGTAAMVGQPDPAGIFAGKHAGTGGGADRVGGVGVVKKDSPFGQGIEVGGLVKGAAGKAEIGVAEVIHQKQDHIGLVLPRIRKQGNRQGQKESYPSVHSTIYGYCLLLSRENPSHFGY